MGDPDMPHTYTFIPDIGENLVRLGELDDALGRVWHLPSPETRTTREVVALVYQAAGTKPRLKVTPAWQMRALGLVNRTVREINEMRYEFDEPFIVDSSRAETELGLRATPLTDAVDQTVQLVPRASGRALHRKPPTHAARRGTVDGDDAATRRPKRRFVAATKRLTAADELNGDQPGGASARTVSPATPHCCFGRRRAVAPRYRGAWKRTAGAGLPCRGAAAVRGSDRRQREGGRP